MRTYTLSPFWVITSVYSDSLGCTVVAVFPETFVILVSTYAVDDLPPGARSCGAAAYVNKDELSPRVVRRLWESGGDPTWRRDPA